ncbi:hypothetical protein Misp01_03350 [Microtetraspora sp. NBRC 13810]|uniref:nSTAND1 domain-containing NTPase n=1 Tax=Microtetraspora sp. NBRC 13810 TaxID=3030990 RepID=UPI0024A2031C|nr:hypothetical protein [Microtetraspora sp. NBRC 13810]GLW05205.1 hypothetical protein Misp01_03350 [Microtetraspora sp. NBRC 13810]
MGRQEKPVDPAAGPLQRFAFDLRRLREQAGGPTYRQMAARVPASVAALSRAAAGDRLPSLPVLLAYVRACDGDPAEWERRWRELENADAEPPYRGLARFGHEDAGVFFGRDALVADLTGQLAGRRLVAVTGPSGSGKSSLLRAGLVPAVAEAREPAKVVVITPGERPFHTHAAVLRELGRVPGLVVVDQFEEAYTLCADPAERARFVDALLAVCEAGSRSRVVLGVRADFYGRLAEHRRLTRELRGIGLLVGPMTEEELREAIVRPAAGAGLIVERALTERIVQEVAGEPGGLPLMSHALLETWHRRRGRTLTLAGYEAAGGVRGAVAHSAEQVYADLPAGHARLARRILLRLITPGADSRHTRRPARRTELDTGDPAGTALVLERLAQSRLITVDEDTVHLAHEALITSWPRLLGWVEEDRERLRTRDQLAQAAAAWTELDRDPGALYRGVRLAAAEEALAGEHRDDLTAAERAFLTAGLAARDEERRTAARTARRLRALTAALSVLLLVAATGVLVVWRQERAAQDERRQATSRQLAAEARAAADGDVRRAAALALQAYRTAPTAQARDAVLSIAAAPAYTSRLTSAAGAVGAVTFTPDGRLLAYGERDGSVRLWDTRTRSTVAVLRRHSSPVQALAFSPDARRLVSADAGINVVIWDVARRTAIRTVDGPRIPVSGVAFSLDGTRITATTAYPGYDDRVWDAHTGRRLTPGDSAFHALRAKIVDKRCPCDPDLPTTAPPPATTRTELTAATPPAAGRNASQHPATDTAPTDAAPDRATTDGATRPPHTEDATSLDDVYLDDASRGEVSRGEVSRGGASRDGAIRVGVEGCVVYALGVDGRVSACGDPLSGTIGVRREGGDVTLDAGRSEVRALAFSGDARLLVSGDARGATTVWDVDRSGQVVAFRAHVGPVVDVAVSGDGRWLASAGQDGTVVVWDREALPLTRHTAAVTSLAHVPGARTLASAAADSTALLWDRTTGVPTLLDTTGANPANSQTAAADTGWPDTTHSGTNGSGVDGSGTNGSGVDGSGANGSGVDGSGATRSGSDGSATGGGPDGGMPVGAVAFGPGGRVLAVAVGHEVRLWDAIARRPGMALRNTATVRAVDFSPDGRLVTAGGTDGVVRAWDVRTGDVVFALEHAGVVDTLAFLPAPPYLLAVGDSSGAVSLIDPATGRWGAVLPRQAGAIGDLDVAPGGRLLAAVANGRVVFFDTARRAAAGALHGQRDPAGSVAFSPDGRLLASGDHRGTVTVWDVATRRAVSRLTGHDGPVNDVLFTGDSAHVVSAGDDHRIITWPIRPADALPRLAALSH